MDLEGIMLSEISHTEIDNYLMISFICEINKQNKTKQTHKYRDQISGYQRERVWPNG